MGVNFREVATLHFGSVEPHAKTVHGVVSRVLTSDDVSRLRFYCPAFFPERPPTYKGAVAVLESTLRDVQKEHPEVTPVGFCVEVERSNRVVVRVNGFWAGKPTVEFTGDQHRELARTVAKQLRKDGLYLLTPKIKARATLEPLTESIEK